MRGASVPSQRIEQRGRVFEKKVAVFEKCQQSKIDGKACDEQSLANSRISRLSHSGSDRIIRNRGEQDQQQTGGAPRDVKKATCPQQKPFFCSKISQATRNQNNQRKEQQELEGSEDHDSRPWRGEAGLPLAASLNCLSIRNHLGADAGRAGALRSGGDVVRSTQGKP